MTRKCSLCRQEGHQRNQCSNSPFGGAFVHSIKSVDDTPLPESESEPPVEEVLAAIVATMATFRTQIELLKAEVADLETQRTPEMENPLR